MRTYKNKFITVVNNGQMSSSEKRVDHRKPLGTELPTSNRKARYFYLASKRIFTAVFPSKNGVYLKRIDNVLDFKVN